MGRYSNMIKSRACELSEGYEEARDEAFNEEFADMFATKLGRIKDDVTYDDVQGFLDSFTFPEEGDWAMDQAQSEYEGYMDSKYEQMKDERWEKENEDNT